ncbi:malonic semialdehyde reductase [Streptomyces sp. Y7]|uniref:malonic semialdehyde reductase n=1 Tax=Streptomyces sp. Y7 TaxID=3342392 RepID=UPI00371205D5
MTHLSSSAADAEKLYELSEAGRELLFTGARTVNNFSPEPVSDEQLRAVWELSKWPPTSANTNPLRILYVRSPEAKRRLLPHLLERNQAKSESAPVVAVLARDSAYTEHIPRLWPFNPEAKDVYDADPAHRDRQGHFNALLQAGYFILAVRATGLAAGPLLGFDPDGVDGEFFPDGRWRSFLVVNIGRPGHNPWFERLPRLDYHEAVRLV